MTAARTFVASHRRSSGILVLGCIAALVAGSGMAIAAIPSSTDGAITACVNKTTRAVRIIDYQAGRRCTTKETRVSWSKGYRYRGTWSSTVAYAVLDVVTSQGSSYLARAASTGKAPGSNPAAWGLLAAAGAPGQPGASGQPGPAGPGAVTAVAYATVVSPNHEDAAMPGMGLTMRAICGASNTASLYLMDDDASGSYDVTGSYDLTVSPSSHANLIYSGHLNEPNLASGLGPIHYTQAVSTIGLLSEVVLAWAAGPGGIMTVDVVVVRGSHRALVHASMYLAAGECLVQADATPAT